MTSTPHPTKGFPSISIDNNIARSINNMTSLVGEKMTDTADRIRDRAAPDPERESKAANPARLLASRLSRIGGYLRDFDYAQALRSLEEAVAENPRKTVALSLGTGFVLGATLGRGTLLRFAVPTIITPLVKRGWSDATAPDELAGPIDIDEVANAAAQVHLH